MKKPNKPTMKLAIMAHCHDCVGEYLDGKIDCQNPRCPLYSFYPHRKMEPSLWWLDFNPKKKGRVKWEECGRNLTDEQKAQMSENMKKAQAARKKK